MKQHYWFRARRHGIGWVPNTWQGWTVLFAYVGALLYSFFQPSQPASFGAMWMQFLPKAFPLTLILIATTYLKGEPTSWRRGVKSLEEENPPLHK